MGSLNGMTEFVLQTGQNSTATCGHILEAIHRQLQGLQFSEFIFPFFVNFLISVAYQLADKAVESV